MQRIKRLSRSRDRRIRITVLFAILLLILLVPFITAGRASAANLSLSNYLYEDTLSDQNYYTDDYLVNFYDNRGVPIEGMYRLFTYRNESISEYNNDIAEIIEDYNKLSESQQNSVKSDLNRIVRSLCRQDNNLTGLFYEIRHYMLDPNQNHTDDRCNQYISKIQERFNELSELKTNIHTLAESRSQQSTKFFLQPIFNILSGMWVFLGDAITSGTGHSGMTGMFADSSWIFSYSKIMEFANQYRPIFLTLAYLVFIISFFSSIMNSTARFDISDPKVIIKIFAQVIIGKIFLDASFQVCVLLLTMLNDVAAGVAQTGANLIIDANFTEHSSTVPMIGPLITILSSLWAALPIGIFAVAFGATVVKCIIKVMVRSLELTCLIVVSPVFFAFLAGENTKKYFEKFLVAFISVAASIIFIAILYAMGGTLIMDIKDHKIDPLHFSTLGSFIGLFAICTFINKPPKIFSKLLGG